MFLQVPRITESTVNKRKGRERLNGTLGTPLPSGGTVAVPAAPWCSGGPPPLPFSLGGGGHKGPFEAVPLLRHGVCVSVSACVLDKGRSGGLVACGARGL